MRGGYFFRGRRTCFPSSVFFSYGHRLRHALTLGYAFRGVIGYRGGRTCFPAANDYHIWNSVDKVASFVLHVNASPNVYVGSVRGVSLWNNVSLNQRFPSVLVISSPSWGECKGTKEVGPSWLDRGLDC